MPVSVILSRAKNLIDSSTYTFEILRLTPQNDVVGQPPMRGLPVAKFNRVNPLPPGEGKGISGWKLFCAPRSNCGSYFILDMILRDGPVTTIDYEL
jgi:hypothetical protein